MSWAVGIPLSVVMAGGGYLKGSLSESGAVAALLVGSSCFAASSGVGAALIAFFVSSSLLTKYGAKRKRRLEAEYGTASRRSAEQVFANGGVVSALCLAMLWWGLADDLSLLRAKRFLTAALASLCAVQGDTWSSELCLI